MGILFYISFVELDAFWVLQAESTSTTQPSATNKLPPSKPKVKKRKANVLDDENNEDEPAQPQLSPDDVPNFLDLSRSIQFWLRRTITEDDITQGSVHMEKYLKGLAEVKIHLRYSF